MKPRVTSLRCPTCQQPVEDRYVLLTSRQRDVADLLAQACSNQQIGLRLGLPERTVSAYVTRVLATLGVRDRTAAALVVLARQQAAPAPVAPPVTAA